MSEDRIHSVRANLKGGMGVLGEAHTPIFKQCRSSIAIRQKLAPSNTNPAAPGKTTNIARAKKNIY